MEENKLPTGSYQDAWKNKLEKYWAGGVLEPVADWDAPKCECGAIKTVNPNLHARWCPLFKEP